MDVAEWKEAEKRYLRFNGKSSLAYTYSDKDYINVNGHNLHKGDKIRYLDCVPETRIAQNAIPDMQLLYVDGVDGTQTDYDGKSLGKYKSDKLICTYADGPHKGEKVVVNLPAPIGSNEGVHNVDHYLKLEAGAELWHRFEIGEEAYEQHYNTSVHITFALLIIFFVLLIIVGVVGDWVGLLIFLFPIFLIIVFHMPVK